MYPIIIIIIIIIIITSLLKVHSKYLGFYRQDLVLYVMTGGYKVRDMSKKKNKSVVSNFIPYMIQGRHGFCSYMKFTPV